MSKRAIAKAVDRLLQIIQHRNTKRGEPTPEEIIDFFNRLVVKALRRDIRRSAYGGSPGSEAARAVDRFARSKSRALLKKLRKGTASGFNVSLSKNQLLIRFVQSPILDRLIADRRKRWISPLRRQKPEAAPSIKLKNFSFLTHPAETLSALKAIGEIELSASEFHLHFDDEFCLDAGSYLVLAEIWHALRHVLHGGKMQRPVQKVLAATGVSAHTRIKLLGLGKDHEDDGEDVWAFTLQRRRPARSSTSPTVHLEPQTRERTADQLCSKVDEWLGVPGIDLELTQEGRGWIAQIIGELLCNAERHSQAGSDDGDWSTTAFMVRRLENGEHTLRCYMAFLSVGRSIAESLQDAASDIKKELANYLLQHRGCGLSDDTLATVFALQDTVTRDPDARQNGSGGTGLQDVLDFVDDLGGTAAQGKEPCVTVISGSSCIQLRPPYIRGKRRGGPHDPRVIWFNSSNSRDVAPDLSFVSDLKDHFAGTVVSVAFTLDPGYLAARTESENEDD